MWIIQIADLHNSNSYTSEKKKKILFEMVTNINKYVAEDQLVIFAICGDILNKGKVCGFDDAKEFIREVLREINAKNVKYVICPGNHDITTTEQDKCFKDMDKFIFELTQSTMIKYNKKSVNLLPISDIDFIMINSSYHCKREYGRIDLESLSKALEQSKNEKKIIILHHHLIPIREGETSTVVNSYEFLKIIENKNVLAILHGHQHMKMELVIGKNLCRVLGVGSLLTTIGTNYSNEFNMINIVNGEIREIIENRYSEEEMGRGSLGKFIDKSII